MEEDIKVLILNYKQFDNRYVNIIGDTMTGDLVLYDNTIHVKDYTLTVPATGTVALLATANVFTAVQKINVNSTTALLVEQDGVKDNTLIVDTTNGRVGVNIQPTKAFESFATSGEVARFSRLTFATDDLITLFFSSNSGDGTYDYGKISSRIIDGGSASQDSALEFYAAFGGTLLADLALRAGRVNIGNSTATVSKLYVESSIALNVTWAGYFYNLGDNPSVGGVYIRADRNRADAFLLKMDGATTTRFLVSGDGLVTINGSTNGTARLNVIGSTDIVQTIIKAHSTQTTNLTEWQNSSSVVLLSVNKNGALIGGYTLTDGTSNYTHNILEFTNNITAADTSKSFTGLQFTNYVAGTKAQTGFNYGAVFQSAAFVTDSGGAGYVTNLIGGRFIATKDTAGAVVNASAGQFYVANNHATNAITNAYAIQIPAPTATGVITNLYGLYINNISVGGTLNYAIFTNAGLNEFNDQLQIHGRADRIQLVVKGFSTQTANLQEWQNSSAGVLSGADSRGILFSHGGTSATNIFIGGTAGNTTTTGTGNSGIGSGSLTDLTTGSFNIGLSGGGTKITSGSNNVTLGANSLAKITTESGNIAIGESSLRQSVGTTLIAIGTQAGQRISGSSNIFIGGASSLHGSVTQTGVSFNVGIGTMALDVIETNATGNTAIGYLSGQKLTTASNCIFIGHQSGLNQTTTSNLLIIDNQNRSTAAAEVTNAILYGVMAATPASQTLALNAVVSISDGLIVNEGGLSTGDVRFESDTEANMLFLDANADTDGALYFGGTTNGVKINKGGELTLLGTATVFDDLQFPTSSGKVPSSNAPNWETFTTNTSAYAFTVDDFIDLQAGEPPHGWLEGSSAAIHLHFALKTAQSTGADRFAKFTIWFAVADANGTWVEVGPFTAEQTIATGSAALKHYYLEDGDVTLTGYHINSQMVIRVKRIAATGGTEYADDVYITQVGMHFEHSGMGSKTDDAR